MKKLFTLIALLAVTAMGVHAQEKKTWDFTKGLSPETIENLNADATNWTANGADSDGNTNNWQNAVKPSTTEPLKANGEVIAETNHLLFDIGKNKGNSIHLATTKMRLTRDNTIITFPQLKRGQRVTIVGRSANGSATDRGIAPVQDYLTLVDGTTTNGNCIFLGNQVDGSLGTYSFTWEVQAESNDPVDVQFQLKPKGGIDFTLFMIDEGDQAKVINVAYVSDGSQDAVSSYLSARQNTQLTAINAAAMPSMEELCLYDVVVIGPTVPAEGPVAQTLKELLPWTPVLNLNAQLYDTWGYGQPVMPTSEWARIVNMRHALFNNLTIDGGEIISDDDITAIIMSASGEPLQGVVLGSYFEGDAVPAVGMEDGDAPAMMHVHNANHNSYVYLPSVSNYTTSGLAVLENALTLLADSKRDITAATAPSISRVYKDLATEVTIKAPSLPKAQVYYTTNGKEPTTASTLYEGTFVLTQPCTVKAVAIAEGYTLSSVAELAIEIKEQPKTPAIAYEMEDGKTTVTLNCETEDAVIWYNFDNTTDTIKSARYAEPFTIQMPQNVTAFSVAGGEVWSEVAEQRVLVRNPRVVIDVAAHFDAANWNSWSNGNGVFPWGKTAQQAYEQEETFQYDDQGELVTDDNGEPVTITVVGDLMAEAVTFEEPGDEPHWLIKSYGEAVIWQNNGASTDKVGTDEGGYYPSVAEDIDPLFPVTKNDIQFSAVYKNDLPNASIETMTKYQAPLDIVVLANMEGGPLEAQVSADGENWQTVGDEIEKTGKKRMWKKYTRMYDGTDQVFVRLAHRSGSVAEKVFDIYIANQGEQSLALLEQLNAELSGIETVGTAKAKTPAGIYTLGGTRLAKMQRGLNIVVQADGSVRKVMIK